MPRGDGEGQQYLFEEIDPRENARRRKLDAASGNTAESGENVPDPARLMLGDCRTLLKEIPDSSVNAVITDPPYPEIDREYGRWSEADWHDLMKTVVAECRRILKPGGSAMFILQPNSERPGRMRPWLWDFLAWICRDWNQIQDIWWWNISAIPEYHAIQGRFTRPSLKACVWCGPEDPYRNQEAVLWDESMRNIQIRLERRCGNRTNPSRHHANEATMSASALKRGGVTPFNVLPIPNGNSTMSSGAKGHGAGTAYDLADWWIRYITPSGGVVCDPFMGAGTIGRAALQLRRSFIGIEIIEKYFDICCATIR